MEKQNVKNHLKQFRLLFGRIVKRIVFELRDRLKLYESESKLKSDNQDYWNRAFNSTTTLAQDSHWKDHGKFEDEQRWLRLGKEHLDLIRTYSSVLQLNFPLNQIVEWGCGGGANAVHFAPLTEMFIGVDITAESLEECNRQIINIGLSNFVPVLINATTPESVLNEPIKDVDLFICTYVFELIPSQSYGLQILKLANAMLKDNGIAFIQIRYSDGKRWLKPKRWGYSQHPYIMNTYTLEDFWEKTKECGFEPIGIYLKPHQPLVNDSYYAYYFLKKISD